MEQMAALAAMLRYTMEQQVNGSKRISECGNVEKEISGASGLGGRSRWGLCKVWLGDAAEAGDLSHALTGIAVKKIILRGRADRL